MKNLINLLIALLLVSTALVACATPTEVTVETAGETATPTKAPTETPTSMIVKMPDLEGTRWTLDFYLNGEGEWVDVLPGTEISLEFQEEGEIGGSAGCNTYFASYEIEGDSLTVGVIGATEMFCAAPEGIMDQESAYLSMLESAAAYQIKGDSLELFDADSTRLASYTAGSKTGMPNPASVYCEEQGGRLEIRDEEGGQVGYCIFDDGSECEEWAFFRGECAPASVSSLSLEALKNATYPSEIEESGTITLTDGRYEGEPFVEGGASRPVVILVEPVAFGDLDGDGVEDAAVILAANAGGSGTFISLEAVRNEGGEPVHLASYLLGDRVQIESLALEGGQITLEMITHGPDDPMCCPSQRVIKIFALQDEQLVETSSEVISSPSEGESDIVGVVWIWQKFLDQSGQNDIVVIYPPAYRLELLPDGQFNIKADCNLGSGTYTLEGSSLALELGPMTLAECGPSSQYDEYIDLLGQVATYVREGDSLSLNLKYDSGDMRFTKLHAVTGQVMAPEGATLPDGAQLEVKVMDVTQGTPGTQVGGVLRDATQFPIEFEAPYHPPDIDPQNTYGLNVTVKDKEGNLLYTTTQAYHVLTQDSPTYHIEVMVEQREGG